MNPNIIFAHLRIKEGSLFCFLFMRSTQLGCLRLCSWCLWKAKICVPMTRKGALAWFHDVAVQKVLEYWMNSSLKIKLKLNCSWKFRRNWNVPLDLLEKSWWAGFNGIYLVTFGFRMWEILKFWVISAGENSLKKNQVLEGKISWGRGNTSANGTGHTSSC